MRRHYTCSNLHIFILLTALRHATRPATDALPQLQQTTHIYLPPNPCADAFLFAFFVRCCVAHTRVWPVLQLQVSEHHEGPHHFP